MEKLISIDVPEGWELDETIGGGYSGQRIAKIVKLNPIEGTFDWYIIKYILGEMFQNEKGELINHVHSHNLLMHRYDIAPFEYKIGLLRLICDYLNVDWMEFLDIRQSKREFNDINAILPLEFLKSIYDGKTI